jgi:hypothetical protein
VNAGLRGLHREALPRQFHEALGLLDVSQGRSREQTEERSATDRFDHIRMQAALVEAGALAEVGHALDAVVVVRDEHDQRCVVLAPPFEIERDVQGASASPKGRRSHAQKGHEAVACLPLQLVDEARVEPQRDVVEKDAIPDRAHVDPPLVAVERREGSDRVVPVDAQIPGEVVPRPERDADERKVALEGDRGDGGERPVSTSLSEGLRSGVGRAAGGLRRVVVFAENVDVDTKAPGVLGKLLS